MEINMKKLLLSTAFAVLMFTTSAMAFGNYQQPSRLPEPQPGVTTLQCYPPNDHRADDVYFTDVTVNLDSYRNATSIDVVHHLYDGRVRDRGNQYSNDGVQTKRGFLEWYWGGHLFINPQLTMTGRLYFNDQRGWIYEEHIFKNGRQEYWSTAPCNVVVGD